ncbi:sterol desaturase family [Aureobasidium pullulans]|nr:sterol desaturase family [Aureobasidium pullulans]
MAFQALRDEVVYYYGYSQGRGFSISDILSRSSAKILSQVSSLMTIPLPLLSFLAVPFFGSSSTTISLAFFLLTWVTLVSTHDPLYLELIGTLTIRIIFFVLPSLAVLGFDTLIPSLSASIKTRGAAQLPTQLSSRRLRNVLFVSIFNVAFSVFAQGACDYVLTEVLNIRSAIRVSKIPPAPWPTMVKEVLYGLVCRGFLHYFIHRDILHASPRGSILARWHADWAHSLKHPFSLTATYDHPICHLLTDWAPLYLTTLFFRFHVLTWYILTAIVSLEQFFIYSGYSVLPSQILLAGMAQRTDSHYATGGKGNYGHWGVLDWIFGTGCPGDADVMDDVQEEADKRGVRQRASNMMENAGDRVRRASDKPVSATHMLKSPFNEIQKNTTTRSDGLDSHLRYVTKLTPFLHYLRSHHSRHIKPTMLAEMQPHESPKQSIVSAAYDILVQTATILTKFCSGRKTEKSGTIYDWEARLAYVGVDDLDEDSEENQEHDEGLTLERSCGVMRYKD